ncbi:class I SAM-dependent methyltransferase [Aliiroseovarius sp. YM-037]|uniref:class I SAM-dependent methyltransferase n=1 Tax=Aliiroseovarius sp. YM-037 TaxID=3341728 RepID=UPI003A7FE15A
MTVNPEMLNFHVERLFADLSAGYGGVMVSIGTKLGLYKAMEAQGPMTSVQIANRAGCAERYVREWLNSQVAGGYVNYHPAEDLYEMTPEQAMILVDDTSPVYLPHAWQVVASMWADEAKAIEAIRTGRGVAWGDHDGRLYCGVAAFFRNGYSASLVQEWLPALDGVVEKLERGARVADVGCGHGHSAVMMAQAFPNSTFYGYDVHEGSIDEARKVAAAAGVSERVTFEVADASGYAERDLDLVCFFDCLHDMGNPVSAARHARSALAKGGSVMLVEPAAEDRVEDNINPIGRLYYAASTTLCCAHAISENGTHVLGAQAGQRRLSDVFADAGFSGLAEATRTPFNLILQAKA